MPKKLGFFLLLLIFCSACSNSEPAIVKVDTPPEETKSEPELVEEEIDNEKKDEFIEFPLNDEVIRVNLNQIPILRAYLHATKNPSAVIEEMNIERIQTREEGDIYLLRFSCNESGCSYLLLEESTDHTGFLLADMAQYEHSILSPDEKKLLFQFNRKSGSDIAFSDVVVFDLDNWVSLSLENKELNETILDFKQPIFSVSWVNEHQITLTVPENPLSINDDITNRTNGEIPTKTIPFTIKETK